MFGPATPERGVTMPAWTALAVSVDAETGLLQLKAFGAALAGAVETASATARVSGAMSATAGRHRNGRCFDMVPPSRAASGPGRSPPCRLPTRGPARAPALRM